MVGTAVAVSAVVVGRYTAFAFVVNFNSKLGTGSLKSGRIVNAAAAAMG